MSDQDTGRIRGEIGISIGIDDSIGFDRYIIIAGVNGATRDDDVMRANRIDPVGIGRIGRCVDRNLFDPHVFTKKRNQMETGRILQRDPGYNDTVTMR